MHPISCKSGFQSRHRDACQFRHTFPTDRQGGTCFNLVIEMLVISGSPFGPAQTKLEQCFNLVIEMLVISGSRGRLEIVTDLNGKFQSRNRDACHFRVNARAFVKRVGRFQSRNRDACHFRWDFHKSTRHWSRCFNLVIEMLVISGTIPAHRIRGAPLMFQSRNRDACHFRSKYASSGAETFWFQSRHRDACHFRQS